MSEPFEYFICERPPYTVISFSGEMSKNSNSVIEACQSKLEASAGHLFALSFHDVTQIDHAALSTIVCFQKYIRDKRNSSLRVCFLKKEIGKFLLEKAVIRETELCTDLATALNELKATQSGQA